MTVTRYGRVISERRRPDIDVSVVIPCFNAAPYLAQTIGSVLDQTLLPREVIVVDDGSTDGSLVIARRFEANSEGRVRVFSERHRQASRVRNIGALAASGEALMFLDADDVLAPETLEELVAALARAPEGVAICPWYRLRQRGGRWERWPQSCAPRRPGQDPLDAWLLRWYHPPVSILWSRGGFERAGRWDESIGQNQDGDLMMRALVAGVPMVEAEGGAGYYRALPEGVTHLAGRRYTRSGLYDRIRVIRKIAWRIEEAGSLQLHRAALSSAFRAIAEDADAEGHRDLAAIADAGARRYETLLGMTARISGLDAVAATSQQVARRARWAYRGLRRRTWGRGDRRQDRTAARPEVVFGIATAERVGSAPAPTSAPPVVPRPTVSVIVPTYNRAHLLPRAIDSALAQTFESFEVLVVDDGSTDGTHELLAGYDDRRVRYLRQPHNQGVSAARNRGLRESRGEFLAFLDSDDEWLPHKLAVQIERLRESPPDVGLVYGAVENHDEHGLRDVDVPAHRGDVFEDLLTVNVIHGTSSVVLRRHVVATVGFFDEAIPAIEDYDYWLRISRFFRIDFIETPVSRYFDEGDVDRKSLNASDNMDARAWFYAKHGEGMRRSGVAHRFLLQSVRRHLAAGDVRGARSLAIRALLHAPTLPEPYRRIAGTLEPGWAKELRRDEPLSRGPSDRIRSRRSIGVWDVRPTSGERSAPFSMSAR